MYSQNIKIIKFVQILFYLLAQSNAQLEEWKIPCGAIYKPKNCENASLETLKIVEDYVRCAPARLDPISRDYVWCAAGREATMFQNKEAFSRIWIKKKVLRNNANHSLETTVFGRPIAFPLGISPTVGHSIFHPEGEIGTAKGAASMGVIMVLNSFSLIPLEDVAASVPAGTELWMQTYVHPKRQLTVDVVRRAERAGFKAIVATIDEPFDTDLRCDARTNFFNTFIDSHQMLQNPNANLRPTHSSDTDIDTTLTFEILSWLATHTKLPIIAKGILTAEDALLAINAGASAIFVSNQGGRELDGSLPTIDALPSIVKAVKSLYPNVDVFMDGGIRSGHDIYKALARGAKAAFIGRPAIWGLTMGGELGVHAVLSILKDEFKEAMLHAGDRNPSLIASSSLISQWIYSDFH